LGAAGFWQLGGNAGTTPGSSFLGTSDNQPLELRVNNTTALKLQPSVWGASVAAGGSATASGVTAVSMGYNTIASGSGAVALGEVTTASGDYATAMGSNTRATNTCATAMGTNTLAGGVASTAMGRNTKALGSSSVSMGLWSTASGANSLAGGYSCAAAGSSSFALGYYAFADHGYSFVWCDGSSGTSGDMHTTADNQFLIGATGGVGINTNNPGTAALCVNGTVAATIFSGSGAGLTGLTAANLTGTVPLAQLPSAVVTNNESGVTLGGLNINGANLVMNDKDIQLRSTYDHGIGWYGSGKPFAGVSVDGPVVYGYSGGGLGIVHSGSTSNIVVYWNSSGNVGIGTTSPNALLTVNGTADKPGGGSWSTFSDVRLKKNIQPLSGVLQKLLALRGVSFEYKEPEKIHELSGKRIGMIAQEVERVFPDWVESGPEGYKRLTYRGFEALTVEALRELRDEKDVQLQARDAEMQGLNQKVEQKETEITELKTRLERLEQLVTAKNGGGQ
jgi:hypothetical protein